MDSCREIAPGKSKVAPGRLAELIDSIVKFDLQNAVGIECRRGKTHGVADEKNSAPFWRRYCHVWTGVHCHCHRHRDAGGGWHRCRRMHHGCVASEQTARRCEAKLQICASARGQRARRGIDL